jgi:hypothetical protein
MLSKNKERTHFGKDGESKQATAKRKSKYETILSLPDSELEAFGGLLKDANKHIANDARLEAILS